MKLAENIFVVPSYRLRDVGATIEAYDEHFWSNGRSVKISADDDMRPYALVEGSPESLGRDEISRGRLFTYQGEVSLQDSEEILEKIITVHQRILKAASSTKNEERKKALILFAENLARAFYGFEPDFFQQNVSRIVDDVVSQIHASLEIWPMLVETCYFHKDNGSFRRSVSRTKKSGPE